MPGTPPVANNNGTARPSATRKNNNAREPASAMAHPVQLLLHVHNHARLFHWSTDSYGRHLISERLYRALGPTIDKFVELLVAAEGAALALPAEIPLPLRSLDAGGMTEMLQSARTSLSAGGTLIAKLCHRHLELASVRDELLEHIGRALYLFRKGP